MQEVFGGPDRRTNFGTSLDAAPKCTNLGTIHGWRAIKERQIWDDDDKNGGNDEFAVASLWRDKIRRDDDDKFAANSRWGEFRRDDDDGIRSAAMTSGFCNAWTVRWRSVATYKWTNNFCKKMVDNKTIEESNVCYYLEQAQHGIVPVAMLGPFEIVFHKQQLRRRRRGTSKMNS